MRLQTARVVRRGAHEIEAFMEKLFNVSMQVSGSILQYAAVCELVAVAAELRGVLLSKSVSPEINQRRYAKPQESEKGALAEHTDPACLSECSISFSAVFFSNMEYVVRESRPAQFLAKGKKYVPRAHSVCAICIVHIWLRSINSNSYALTPTIILRITALAVFTI